jgi:hypothetical protein
MISLLSAASFVVTASERVYGNIKLLPSAAAAAADGEKKSFATKTHALVISFNERHISL